MRRLMWIQVFYPLPYIITLLPNSGNITDFFAYKKAEAILQEHIDKLHSVAGVLLEKEKIDGEEFDQIFNS